MFACSSHSEGVAELLFNGAKNECYVCNVVYLTASASGTVATCASDQPDRVQMFHPLDIIALQLQLL